MSDAADEVELEVEEVEEEEEEEEEEEPVAKPSSKSSIRVLPEAGEVHKTGASQFTQQVTEEIRSEQQQTITPAQTASEILPPQESGPGAPAPQVVKPEPVEEHHPPPPAAEPPKPEPAPAPAPTPAPTPAPAPAPAPAPQPAPVHHEPPKAAPGPVQQPAPQPVQQPKPAPVQQPATVQEPPKPKPQPQPQPQPQAPKQPEPQPPKQAEPPKPAPVAAPHPRPADMEPPIQARYVPQVTAEPKPAAPPPTRTVLGESDWANPEANPEHQPIKKIIPVGRLGKQWPPAEEAPPEREHYIGKVKVAGDDAWRKEEEAENLYTAAPWGGVRKGGKQWPPPEPEKILVPYKSPVIDRPVEHFRERPDNYQLPPPLASNAAALPAFQGQVQQVAPVAPQVPLPMAKRQQPPAQAPPQPQQQQGRQQQQAPVAPQKGGAPAAHSQQQVRQQQRRGP